MKLNVAVKCGRCYSTRVRTDAHMIACRWHMRTFTAHNSMQRVMVGLLVQVRGVRHMSPWPSSVNSTPHVLKQSTRSCLLISALIHLRTVRHARLLDQVPSVWSQFWVSDGAVEDSVSLSYDVMGRDSSVGIATRYGLHGPGIESRWGRDFPHSSRPALGSTQPPIQWVPGLSRG
jgi:hypothetical protein